MHLLGWVFAILESNGGGVLWIDSWHVWMPTSLRRVLLLHLTRRGGEAAEPEAGLVAKLIIRQVSPSTLHLIKV